MIDHVTVRVQDFSRLVDFYRAALAPLGYDVLMEYPGAAGLGADGTPDLWLMRTDQPLNPTHLALSADRALVDAFHAAALAAGGADNGPPGVRADYHPHYYTAFIHDPEGNNVEVVCHADPEAKPARPAAARKAAPKKTAQARKPAAKARKSAKPARAAARKSATKPAKKSSAKKAPAKKKSKSRR